MPMSFSLTQMLLISAAYLAALFAVAWISERGMIPRAIIRHPLTYTLSLGVYASAWAFYGTVGLAYQYGYGFLSSYLGVSGAFLLAPVLLYPILKITRTYQLSSLTALFAATALTLTAGLAQADVRPDHIEGLLKSNTGTEKMWSTPTTDTTATAPLAAPTLKVQAVLGCINDVNPKNADSLAGFYLRMKDLFEELALRDLANKAKQ